MADSLSLNRKIVRGVLCHIFTLLAPAGKFDVLEQAFYLHDGLAALLAPRRYLFTGRLDALHFVDGIDALSRQTSFRCGTHLNGNPG